MSADRTEFARCVERVISHLSPPQRAVVPVNSIVTVGLSSRYRATSPRASCAADGSRNVAVFGWDPTGRVSGREKLGCGAGHVASGGIVIRFTGGTPRGAGFSRGDGSVSTRPPPALMTADQIARR